MMNKEYIREIALRCGFKLKKQLDGLDDLNPYVYKFAEELISHKSNKNKDGHSVRSLKQFEVVEGTTWIPTHDEFGTSFQCSVCGAHEFYCDEIPSKCDHSTEGRTVTRVNPA